MSHKIEFEREHDGRWIAEIPSISGAVSYGKTKAEAATNARVIAEQILESQGTRSLNQVSV